MYCVVVLVLCVCLAWGGRGVEAWVVYMGGGVVGVCVAGEWVQVLLFWQNQSLCCIQGGQVPVSNMEVTKPKI